MRAKYQCTVKKHENIEKAPSHLYGLHVNADPPAQTAALDRIITH